MSISSLNQEQSDGYNAVKNILVSLGSFKDPIKVLIDGPAGSGKTFLIYHIIELIESLNIEYELLAPTNKATNVINSKILTKRAQTLGRYFGYSEEITSDGNRISYYGKVMATNKEKKKILIIDECSMVGKEVYSMLIPYNCIFMGDMCQLNPVNEDISPIFGLKHDCRVSLVKNERIKNDDTATTILKFREFCTKRKITENILEKYYITKRDFFNKAMEHFKKNDDAVILSYTNASVNKYNEIVRKRLFGNPDIKNEVLDKYYESEQIVFSEYYRGKSTYYTSQRCIINSCNKVIKHILLPSCICEKLLEALQSDKQYSNTLFSDTIFSDTPNNNTISRCSACKTPFSPVSTVSVEMYVITLKNIDPTDTEVYEDVFFSPIEEKEVQNILNKYRFRAKSLCNKFVWEDLYIREINMIAPFSYRYSITVHKSQGSEYSVVFVDFDNFTVCKNFYERLRLMYTAVSRSSDELYIYSK